jgi:thiol-disulfide isomerase/thioredoxin
MSEPIEMKEREAPGPEEAKAAPLGKQAKFAVVALALVAVVALFWPRGDGSFEAPGGFLVDAGGRPVTLGSRLAPVSLVHFWATWCPPCITEIPALKRLASDLRDESSFDLLMIAVDNEVGDVEPFLGSLAAMALYDPSWEVAHRYGTRKLPETYLVVKGQVVEKWIGATDWDHPEVRERIRQGISDSGLTTSTAASR